MKDATAARVTFTTKRNIILAAVAGPSLTLLSIALMVTDQGFDSVAGFWGFVILVVASALISVIVFLVAGLLAAMVSHILKRLAPLRTAVLAGKIVLLLLVVATYFIAFRMPTMKPQLFFVTLLAAAFGLLLTARVLPRQADHHPDAEFD